MRGEPQNIQIGTALDLLTNPSRRQILHHLAEKNHQTTIDQLSSNLQSIGNNQTIELYHSHLPKLDQEGVISFDECEGSVEPGENFAELYTLLGVIENHWENTKTEVN
jgi:predicted transcriptional regulator